MHSETRGALKEVLLHLHERGRSKTWSIVHHWLCSLVLCRVLLFANTFAQLIEADGIGSLLPARESHLCEPNKRRAISNGHVIHGLTVSVAARPAVRPP